MARLIHFEVIADRWASWGGGGNALFAGGYIVIIRTYWTYLTDILKYTWVIWVINSNKVSQTLCDVGKVSGHPYLLILGAESFLRSHEVFNSSKNSPHFMKPKGSLPQSQVPTTCSYQSIIPGPRLAFWLFRTMIRFYGETLLAHRPIPKLEDHPLSAVRDCLINMFAATLHIGGRSSIRKLMTRHAMVTGNHLSPIQQNLAWPHLSVQCSVVVHQMKWVNARTIAAKLQFPSSPTNVCISLILRDFNTF